MSVKTKTLIWKHQKMAPKTSKKGKYFITLQFIQFSLFKQNI